MHICTLTMPTLGITALEIVSNIYFVIHFVNDVTVISACLMVRNHMLSAVVLFFM